MLLLTGAMVIPMFSAHGLVVTALLFPFVVLIIGVAYVLTGDLIRRRRRLGAWLGVTLGALTAILQFVMHLYILRLNLTPGWLVVDALLLVLLLANWGQFGKAAPGVGA